MKFILRRGRRERGKERGRIEREREERKKEKDMVRMEKEKERNKTAKMGKIWRRIGAQGRVGERSR